MKFKVKIGKDWRSHCHFFRYNELEMLVNGTIEDSIVDELEKQLGEKLDFKLVEFELEVKNGKLLNSEGVLKT